MSSEGSRLHAVAQQMLTFSGAGDGFKEADAEKAEKALMNFLRSG